MYEPKGRVSRWRRRALFAALILVGVGVVAAVLAWPSPPPRPVAKPALVQADPTPPPPLRVAEPEPRPDKKKPKPRRVEKPKPKPRKLRVRVDRRAADPASVSIPSVGISAPTISLGLTKSGKLEVPVDFSKAGWRAGGPEPGERGAAMITAHVDSKSGPAAFYSLGEVSPGDEIKVRRKDGSTVTFVAQRMERVSKDNFPTRRVYGKTRLPTLRLVTCSGAFDESSGHYRDNLVVYATRKAS